MLGTIFGLMLLLLVLTVPIGVVLLCVSLFPVLIDHNFIASVPFVLRNMIARHLLYTPERVIVVGSCETSHHYCPMCVQPPSALTVTYKMIVTVC